MLLTERGAQLTDIPIIQPADLFLDMAGEDLRRRIFLTENEEGDSLCLRPEFTIPVCSHHIIHHASIPKRYAYIGKVFRQRREGKSEFYQAGIEDLGDVDEAYADARSLADGVACVHSVASSIKLKILLGDQAVFEAVLAALGIPSGWQKKVIRTFGNSAQLKSLIIKLSSKCEMSALSEPLALLVASKDEIALAACLETKMQEAGISPNAGRTPIEIAHRMIEKANLASIRISTNTLAVLETFLMIRETLDQASERLRAFAAENHLDLDVALQFFEKRISAIALAGIDPKTILYDAAFGRPLDYYTGLVYEIRVVSREELGAIIGGGRYDRLLTLLGASTPIPGVGFSIWLDRLETLVREAE